MRLLIVGDTHGNVPFLEDMCHVARKNDCDRIVQVGDWGYLWPGQKKSGLKSAQNKLAEFDLQMFFLDGNHEWHDHLEGLGATKDAPEMIPLSSRIYYLSRGLTWMWDEVSFMSLGGAYSIDQEVRKPWISWWPTEVLTYADCVRAIENGPVDVMLTHDAPPDVPRLESFLLANDERMAYSYGQSWHYKLRPQSTKHREMLGQVVEQVNPRLLVHGHYHFRYQGQWKNTKVIGLDCDGSGRDAWMVLDTEQFKEKQVD